MLGDLIKSEIETDAVGESERRGPNETVGDNEHNKTL
jgi:hypothetical protein